MKLISTNKKSIKIIFIISSIFFLWISTFGLVFHIEEMQLEGNQSNCLFDDGTSGCAMNFSEHINIWNEIFTIVPQNILEMINILILSILLATTFIFWKKYRHISAKFILSRFRLYIKWHPHINLFNYLKEIFSRGILNTKIYETVII